MNYIWTLVELSCVLSLLLVVTILFAELHTFCKCFLLHCTENTFMHLTVTIITEGLKVEVLK